MRRGLDLKAEVAAIGDLSRDELCQRWQKIYGQQPPKGVRRELIIKAVAWHLQAKCLGGYTAETRRLLRSAIDDAGKKLRSRVRLRITATDSADSSQHLDVRAAKPMDIAAAEPASGNTSRVGIPQAQRRELRPGARLLRDWNGKTHVVEVIEGGFVFEAQVHGSLSAIARKITGAHWSGPRFFGL